MGIEPTLEAWEASVLPLNYTRLRDPQYRDEATALTSPRRAPVVPRSRVGIQIEIDLDFA